MSDGRPSSRARPETGRPVLSARAGAALGVVVVLLAILAIPFKEWITQRARIADLEGQLAWHTQRTEDLTAALQRWDDPAYVEAQARARLHFVHPGEVGYVSRYIKLTFFGPPDDMGFSPLSTQHFHWLVMGSAVIALGVQALHVILRQRFSAPLGRNGRDVNELLRVYRNRTLSLMAASELPVLLGFTLFLVQGHLYPVFLFGLVSLIYYGQSYPSESQLSLYAKTRAAA